MLNNQVLDLKSQETIAARKIYPKALNLIERDQNFDEILKKTETISTAVHLLCPNLPGLPTKLRGKYQKWFEHASWRGVQESALNDHFP